MTDEDFSANIDWKKKKSFSTSTRESRKIDAQKATLSDKKDRNKFTEPVIKTLAPNLKKLRKKIKDVYDDEDDDENEEIVFFFPQENSESGLMNALKDEEKIQLKYQNTIENQKLQETAGKMEAVMAATKVSKKLGIKPLEDKELNQKIAAASLPDETFSETLTKNIKEKSKLDIKKIDIKRGTDMLKEIKGIGSKVSIIGEEDKEEKNILGLKKTEVGKKDDPYNKIAKTILKKSGRISDDNKKHIKNKENSKNKTLKQNIKKTKTR